MPFVEDIAKSKAPSPRPLKQCSNSAEGAKILWQRNTTNLTIRVWHARVLNRLDIFCTFRGCVSSW